MFAELPKAPVLFYSITPQKVAIPIEFDLNLLVFNQHTIPHLVLPSWPLGFDTTKCRNVVGSEEQDGQKKCCSWDWEAEYNNQRLPIGGRIKMISLRLDNGLLRVDQSGPITEFKDFEGDV